MREIAIDLSTVNVEGLDAALRAALDEKVVGVSVRRGEVVAYLTDDARKADIAQVQTIAAAHDPSVLTPAQQERQTLLTMRAANSTPLDPAKYKGESPLVRALAEKIAWLEREIGSQGRG